MSVIGKSNLKQDEIVKLRRYLISMISREMEGVSGTNVNQENMVTQLLTSAYTQTKLQLPNTIRDQLFHDILDELLGFGVIQSLIDDPDISEIMVNGPDRIYVEKGGKLIKTNIKFENNQEVMKIIEKIIFPLGRRIDVDSPTVDARLPDGSRVNAVIPPVAVDGPGITIRKFQKEKLGIDQLIAFESLSEQMAEFLRACVLARMNIIISGGTGSGKTTLLNVLSSNIPDDERIVTIEDAAELNLQQDHVFRMETKPPDIEGKNSVSIRELVRNSLRMRPDRIVVGEVRGGEALDMLQAMNTGHDGSLTTLHANTPRDALSRLETMSMMSGMELPLKVIRQQIAAAIDLIVQQTRLKDGSRKITAITEVAGMESDTIVMTDIYRFAQTGMSEDNKIIGEFKPTGIRPLFMPRLEMAGLHLGAEMFGATAAAILSQRMRKP
ncbi:MAG: CpaF family protein [Anaerolineaceae bacterium]|nr:CpaF family protein [Anaerolineaceae bacterium]